MSTQPPPLPIQLKLQNQLKKRINETQPSKNDLQYYQRKIRRIENQFAISQDEVSKLRVKLKRQEDFEFKYDVLFRQHTDLKNECDSKGKEIGTLQALNQQLKLTLEEKASHMQDFSLERANLMEEIAMWKDRYDQLTHQNRIDIEDQRIRSQEVIKLNDQKLRSEYKEHQEDMLYEIHQLKKSLQEKQTVESIIGQRVEKVRTEKDEEIERLKGIMQQRKDSYENYMHEKNEELERMKDKFEKMINFDIENLKHNQEDQEEVLGIELNGLREMIGLKNDEIEKLLAEIQRMAKQHETNRRELLQEITILKEKIYVIEKESDLELQNMKDRLIAIHAQDSKSMEDRYERIIDTLKNDLDDTRKYIKELERMQSNAKNEFQRAKGEFHDRLKEKDKRIGDLLDSLRDRGQVNASQLKSLHQSFHLITSQKQIMASEYQSNVTFLNQQITKLNTISEIKTKEITKLHEEIHTMKITYEERLVEWESKYRRERKEREDEREQERVQRDKLNERLEDQEREFKNQMRRIEREREKLQKEKNKAEYMLEQAERDIDRLNKYIKQLDDSLKTEFKKNQLATLDKDGLRRQILSELEKQKIELEAMKLMEIDQMRKRYEMENARLLTSNEQLKTQILNKSIAYENLESEFKKIDYKHRNSDKLQRDKIKEYEQKMITLTQEINITQDLYKAFLEAKARAGER